MKFWKKNNKEDEVVETLKSIESAIKTDNDAVEKLGVRVDNLGVKVNNLENDYQVEFNSLNEKINKQAKLIEQLQHKLNNLIVEKPEENINNDYLKDLEDKYAKSVNYGKKYNHDIHYYDGFYFKSKRGSKPNRPQYNILDLIDINQHINDYAKGLVTGKITEVTLVKMYDISKNVLPKILYNLVATDFYDEFISDYYKPHTYQFIGNMLYIDNVKTGLKIDDVNYIKTCINNNNNTSKTIEKFMGYFKEIDNHHIRIIATNIDKIPNNMLQNTNTEMVNNPEKRKERGLI